MERILEVSRMQILISIAICTLLSACFGFGQVTAADGSKASAYQIDVATNAITQANDYMQIVVYVAAVVVFCACIVIIMLAGKDYKKKRAMRQDVTVQIRDLYAEGK